MAHFRLTFFLPAFSDVFNEGDFAGPWQLAAAECPLRSDRRSATPN